MKAYLWTVLIVAALAVGCQTNGTNRSIDRNESAAIGTLRTVIGAQVTFHNDNGRYATSFEELTNPEPAYLDGDWIDKRGEYWMGERNGYRFILTGDGDNDGDRFGCSAIPVEPSVSGNRYFWTDERGVLRYEVGRYAARDSRPIGS